MSSTLGHTLWTAPLTVALLLVLSQALCSVEAIPVWNAAVRFPSSVIRQLTYNLDNDTVYAAHPDKYLIFAFYNVSTSPLTPSISWNPYALIAGSVGNFGPPSFSEVHPFSATFEDPSGVIGWPLHAFMNTVASPTTTRWLGLWVCDRNNHAVRFINFLRGNNVTLVAGDGTSGGRDGIGTNATLNEPKNIVWGRFLTTASTTLTSPQQQQQRMMTTMLLWNDKEGHCIRSAIPWSLKQRTPLILYDDASMMSMSASLMNMTLNVSTFIGVCGSPAAGVVGLAFNVPILDTPNGVAVVNPFTTLRNYTKNNMTTKSGLITSTSVLFISESDNQRLTMITPMFPAVRRYLLLIRKSSGSIDGLTVMLNGGWIRHVYVSNQNIDLYVTSLQLISAETNGDYNNVTVSLQWNFTNGTMHVASVESTTIATASFSTSNALVVPYTPQNATLIIFSGDGSVPLAYACCIAKEYSVPIVVSDILPEPLLWNISTNTSSPSIGTMSGSRTISGSSSVTLTSSSSSGIRTDSSTFSSRSQLSDSFSDRTRSPIGYPTPTTWSLSSSSSSSSTLSRAISVVTVSRASHTKSRCPENKTSATQRPSGTAGVNGSASSSTTKSLRRRPTVSSRIHHETSTITTGLSSSVDVPSPAISKSMMMKTHSVTVTPSLGGRTTTLSARRTFSVLPVRIPTVAIAVETAVGVISGTSLTTGSVAFTASTVVFSLQRLNSLMQQCRQQADPPPWPTNPGQWSLDTLPSVVGLWRASWVWLIALQPIAVAVTSVLMYLLRNVFFCSRYHDDDQDDDHDHDDSDDGGDEEEDSATIRRDRCTTHVVHRFVSMAE